jgi:hypothetical protein
MLHSVKKVSISLSLLAALAVTGASANYYNCISDKNHFIVKIVTDQFGKKACGWSVITGAPAPVGNYNPTMSVLNPGMITTIEINNPTIDRCTPKSLSRPTEMQFDGESMQCYFAPKGAPNLQQNMSFGFTDSYQLEQYMGGKWVAVTDSQACPNDNNEYCRVAPAASN